MHININVDQLREIAEKGVRRTAVFLGLGLNAANRDDFVDYELSKLPRDDAALGFHFVAPNAPPETVAHYKQEFALWLTGCGLRELIENFAVFLDGIYNNCVLVRHVKGKGDLQQTAQAIKIFHKVGLGEKLDKLRDAPFGVGPQYPEYLKSIQKARNCLTHRLGVVALEKDCGDDGLMHVGWQGIEFLVELKHSKKIIGLSEAKKIHLPEPGHTRLKPVERDLCFKPGEILRLSSDHLAEICLFIVNCTGQVVKSFLAYLNQMEIPLVKAGGNHMTN